MQYGGKIKMEKHITTLCFLPWEDCPELFVDNDNEQGRQVIIKDDFGNKVYMSKEHLKVFVNKARNGIFEKGVLTC
jgi:hypothetical protein